MKEINISAILVSKRKEKGITQDELAASYEMLGKNEKAIETLQVAVYQKMMDIMGIQAGLAKLYGNLFSLSELCPKLYGSGQERRGIRDGRKICQEVKNLLETAWQKHWDRFRSWQDSLRSLDFKKQ